MIRPQTCSSAGASYSDTTAVQNTEVRHGIALPPATSLSLVLRDPDPEVESYTNETDNVGSFVPPTSQDQNELQGLGSTPDFSQGSVEVAYGGFVNVRKSMRKGVRLIVKTPRMYSTNDPDDLLSVSVPHAPSLLY